MAINKINYKGTEYDLVDDSGWIDIELPDTFVNWDPDDATYHNFAYRKIGNIVELRGVIQPVADIVADVDERVTILTLPEEIRPTSNPLGHPVYRLCPGEGDSYFTLRFASSGPLTIINYHRHEGTDTTVGTIKANDRLFIDVTYFIN